MSKRYIRIQSPEWYWGGAPDGILDTVTGKFAPFALSPSDRIVEMMNEGDGPVLGWCSESQSPQADLRRENRRLTAETDMMRDAIADAISQIHAGNESRAREILFRALTEAAVEVE